jgi:hypothetical protein
MAILANSRPYEGLLLCIPCGVYFLLWMAGKLKTRVDIQLRIRQVFLPLLASMLILGALMAYYNGRLTGNPFLLPHVLNSEAYITAPEFVWRHAKPPLTYHNALFETMYNGWERAYYRTTWEDFWRISEEKIDLDGRMFFWRAELVLLPFVPFLFRDRKMRLPLTGVLLGTLGIFLVVWGQPHYAAPFAGALILLVVQAMRHLNTVEVQGLRIGAMVTRAMVVILLALTAERALSGQGDEFPRRCEGIPERAAIVSQLEKIPGKHLILVRYAKFHDPHTDWVYNGAEIDSAKILWARDIDALQNQKLADYFKARQIWLLEPDELKPLVLKHYSGAELDHANR